MFAVSGATRPNGGEVRVGEVKLGEESWYLLEPAGAAARAGHLDDDRPGPGAHEVGHVAAVGGEDEIGLVEEGALTPGREAAEVVGLRDDGAEAARARDEGSGVEPGSPPRRGVGVDERARPRPISPLVADERGSEPAAEAGGGRGPKPRDLGHDEAAREAEAPVVGPELDGRLGRRPVAQVGSPQDPPEPGPVEARVHRDEDLVRPAEPHPLPERLDGPQHVHQLVHRIRRGRGQ
mmetsp:Transcript_9834/g.28664  ORF Transcript_9834/g.28664 Transcript_9834/m.28664 type:complete len:236 (-) Transcript_9834:336-1043(-)